MSITYTIPGATLLDQLNPTTLDGLPNNDANDDCVPTSIAEALHILTGRAYDGDELKDAVYGTGYVGFQSAQNYVAYCAQQGVDLAAHNDTQTGLIAEIHNQVSAGHPVLVTMPSMWGTAPADPVHPSGSTHVGVAVGVGAGEIRVMNPWHGFWQDQPDSWWQARLCYGQVWPLQKKASANMVPNGWTDDGTTLRAPVPNDFPIVQGHREFVLSHGWDPADVPMGPAEWLTPVELGNPSLGNGSAQFFRISGQLSWTSANGMFRTYNGQEEFALHTALDAANQAAAKAQADLAAGQAAEKTTQDQLAAAQAQIAQLQQQLATVQAAPTAQESAALAVVQAIKAALASS